MKLFIFLGESAHPTHVCGIRLCAPDKEGWLWWREDYSTIALIAASLHSWTVAETIDQDGGSEAERNRLWKITFQKATNDFALSCFVLMLSDGSIISLSVS